MRLAQPKDGHQGVVDTPLLLRAYPSDEFTEQSGFTAPLVAVGVSVVAAAASEIKDGDGRAD